MAHRKLPPYDLAHDEWSAKLSDLTPIEDETKRFIQPAQPKAVSGAANAVEANLYENDSAKEVVPHCHVGLDEWSDALNGVVPMQTILPEATHVKLPKSLVGDAGKTRLQSTAPGKPTDVSTSASALTSKVHSSVIITHNVNDEGLCGEIHFQSQGELLWFSFPWVTIAMAQSTSVLPFYKLVRNEKSKQPCLKLKSGTSILGDLAIARYIHESSPSSSSVPISETAQVDSWLDYAQSLMLVPNRQAEIIEMLELNVNVQGFLMAKEPTVADVAIFAAMEGFTQKEAENAAKGFPKALKWIQTMSSSSVVQGAKDVVLMFLFGRVISGPKEPSKASSAGSAAPVSEDSLSRSLVIPSTAAGPSKPSIPHYFVTSSTLSVDESRHSYVSYSKDAVVNRENGMISDRKEYQIGFDDMAGMLAGYGKMMEERQVPRNTVATVIKGSDVPSVEANGKLGGAVVVPAASREIPVPTFTAGKNETKTSGKRGHVVPFNMAFGEWSIGLDSSVTLSSTAAMTDQFTEGIVAEEALTNFGSQRTPTKAEIPQRKLSWKILPFPLQLDERAVSLSNLDMVQAIADAPEEFEGESSMAVTPAVKPVPVAPAGKEKALEANSVLHPPTASREINMVAPVVETSPADRTLWELHVPKSEKAMSFPWITLAVAAQSQSLSRFKIVTEDKLTGQPYLTSADAAVVGDFAMAQYVLKQTESSTLSALKEAVTDSWVDYAQSMMMVPNAIAAIVDTLELELRNKTFLAGDAITIADFSVYAAMGGFTGVATAPKDAANTESWIQSMATSLAVQEATRFVRMMLYGEAHETSALVKETFETKEPSITGITWGDSLANPLPSEYFVPARTNDAGTSPYTYISYSGRIGVENDNEVEEQVKPFSLDFDDMTTMIGVYGKSPEPLAKDSSSSLREIKSALETEKSRAFDPVPGGAKEASRKKNISNVANHTLQTPEVTPDHVAEETEAANLDISLAYYQEDLVAVGAVTMSISSFLLNESSAETKQLSESKPQTRDVPAGPEQTIVIVDKRSEEIVVAEPSAETQGTTPCPTGSIDQLDVLLSYYSSGVVGVGAISSRVCQLLETNSQTTPIDTDVNNFKPTSEKARGGMIDGNQLSGRGKDMGDGDVVAKVPEVGTSGSTNVDGDGSSGFTQELISQGIDKKEADNLQDNAGVVQNGDSVEPTGIIARGKMIHKNQLSDLGQELTDKGFVLDAVPTDSDKGSAHTSGEPCGLQARGTIVDENQLSAMTEELVGHTLENEAEKKDDEDNIGVMQTEDSIEPSAVEAQGTSIDGNQLSHLGQELANKGVLPDAVPTDNDKGSVHTSVEPRGVQARGTIVGENQSDSMEGLAEQMLERDADKKEEEGNVDVTHKKDRPEPTGMESQSVLIDGNQHTGLGHVAKETERVESGDVAVAVISNTGRAVNSVEPSGVVARGITIDGNQLSDLSQNLTGKHNFKQDVKETSELDVMTPNIQNTSVEPSSIQARRTVIDGAQLSGLGKTMLDTVSLSTQKPVTIVKPHQAKGAQTAKTVTRNYAAALKRSMDSRKELSSAGNGARRAAQTDLKKRGTAKLKAKEDSKAHDEGTDALTSVRALLAEAGFDVENPTKAKEGFKAEVVAAKSTGATTVTYQEFVASNKTKTRPRGGSDANLDKAHKAAVKLDAQIEAEAEEVDQKVLGVDDESRAERDITELQELIETTDQNDSGVSHTEDGDGKGDIVDFISGVEDSLDSALKEFISEPSPQSVAATKAPIVLSERNLDIDFATKVSIAPKESPRKRQGYTRTEEEGWSEVTQKGRSIPLKPALKKEEELQYPVERSIDILENPGTPKKSRTLAPVNAPKSPGKAVHFDPVVKKKKGSKIKKKTLWIGGSSGLARSYVMKFGHKNLVLADTEEVAPEWASDTEWVTCDLASVSAGDVFDPSYKSLIINVSGSLWATDGMHEKLLAGLVGVMKAAIRCGVLRVLHISSVAALNHAAEHVDVNESDELPPIEEYRSGFDIFKRKSEDVITQMCEKHDIPFTHLRVGHLFMDSPVCDQCGVLAIQSRVGSFISTPIDYNSSRNAALAVHSIMTKMKNADAVEPVYYYTRPTVEAASYGSYLHDYMKAYGIRLGIWMPFWLMTALLWPLNFFFFKFTPLKYTGLGRSISCLLQVNVRQHTFDNSRFRRDFKEVAKQEESFLDCFNRRRQLIQEGKQ